MTLTQNHSYTPFPLTTDPDPNPNPNPNPNQVEAPPFYEVRHSQTERKPQGGAFGHKAKPTAPRRRASARAARTRAAQLDALLRGTFAEPAAVPTDPSRRNVASFRY